MIKYLTTAFNKSTIFQLCLFGIVFITSYPKASAQTYPVQVQPTVTFPSTFLSDYSDPSTVNIRVYLSDITKVNYQVRLKVKLTSDKFSALSKNGILLTLQGGQVYFLNNVELRDLFDANNLLINTNVQTSSDNSLPEGVYTMSFEAYDATLPGNIVVSNAGTDFTVFSVNRYDPPLLTSPANKQEFDVATVNQNIFFSWTPRHVVFSPQQQVKYRFRMIKVLPVDRNPYEAMTNTSPATIDVAGLDFPVFIYTPADLALEEGCVYAWQVTAYEEVLVGTKLEESSARFKNLGMSEVFTLSIKENCQPVTPFVAPRVEQNLIALQWNFDPSHLAYELAYRPLGTSQAWTPVSTVNNLYNLDNKVLQRGVQYEYTVKAKCKNWLEPAYGGTFTLPDATCNAPAPVMVDNSSSDDTKLSWTSVNGVSGYRLQYRNLSDVSYTTIDLDNTTTEYSLPKLTSGGYKIKVDGVCGTEVAEGEANDIAFEETGLVGPCPIPVPFQLMAVRTQGDEAKLSWPLSTAHTGYSITYWHRDSVNVKRTLSSTTPEVLAGHVYDDQLYNYEITFSCATKSTTTPVGMFRVEGNGGGVVTDPTTGNCFPPAVVQAEPRSTSSALFEWSQVNGVDGYQLLYSVKDEKKFVPFNTIATSELLKNLQDSKEYQFVVLSRCGNKYSIPSDTGYVDLSGGKNNAACDSALYFKTDGQTTTNIRLCWPYVTANTGFKLTYREESQSPANEYTDAVTYTPAYLADHLITPGDTIKHTIQNLLAGTSYIFKLQLLCGTDEALRNGPLKVSTMPDAKSSGECGQGQTCDRTDPTPLPSLEEGDSIFCADYGILVAEVTASNTSAGIYSGRGYMNMPVPGLSDFVRMNVSFENVKINKDPNRCIYDGTISIDSINASAVPIQLRDKVKQLEGQIDNVISNAQNALDQAQQGIDAAQQAVQTATDYFQGGDSVGNVGDGGLGEATTSQTITLPATATVNGTTATIAGVTLNSLPGLIKDGTGNVFQVGPDGTVTHVGQYDPTLAGDPTLDLADGRVVYAENTASGKYDFDEWKSQYKGKTQVEREYEQIGTNYYVPAKLILTGELDVVNATVQGGYDKTKIKFANGKGMVYDHTLSGDTFTLKVAGGPAADGQYVYAWFVDGSAKKAIGKLLVPSYAPQRKNVVVIPMSKSVVDAAKLQEGLNNAYAKIGITYTVTLDQSFRWNKSWDLDGDTLVQASGSKLLSTDYKGEEAEMIRKYIEFKGGESNIDPNTAYFFAIYEASKLDDKLLGKMPAEEQFGFLYVGGATPSAMQRTIAHEIGHGAYHMEHSFHPIYLGETSKTKTNNLMDYGDGYELWKYQWDIVHDPGHVWGILKKDRDSEGKKQNYKNKFCEMVSDISFQAYITNAQVFVNKVAACKEYAFPSGEEPKVPDIPFYTTRGNFSGMLQDFNHVMRYYLYRLYCRGVKVNIFQYSVTYDRTEFRKLPTDLAYTKDCEKANYTIWFSEGGASDFMVVNNDGSMNANYSGIGKYQVRYRDLYSKYAHAVQCVLQSITADAGITDLQYEYVSATCDNRLEEAPYVTLDVSENNITEDGGAFEVIVKLEYAVQTDVVVPLDYSGTADRLPDNGIEDDYSGAQLSVVIPAGSTEVRFPITAIRDANIERDENIIIDIDATGITGRAVELGEQVEEVIIREAPLPTLAVITEVRTYIDINGKTTVKWKSTGAINQFSWKLTTSSTMASATPSLTSDGYYTVVINSTNRTSSIDYLIETQDRSTDRGFISVSSKTGNFQGTDCNKCLCDGENYPIGDPSTSQSGYTFQWVVTDGSTQNPDFTSNKNLPSFVFALNGIHTYALKRIHNNAPAFVTGGIIDEGLVLRDPVLNCTWLLIAQDMTPGGGGVKYGFNAGIRKTDGSNRVLQVVEPDNRMDRNGNDYKVYIEDPAPVNKYPNGEPTWTKTGKNPKSFNSSTLTTQDLCDNSNIQDTDPGNLYVTKGQDEYNVHALHDDQQVEVEYFKENLRHYTWSDVREANDDDLTNAVNSGLVKQALTKASDLVDGVVQWVTDDPTFHYDLPIRVEDHIEMDVFNAEKQNSPLVVQDQVGTAENRFICDFCSGAVPVGLGFTVGASNFSGSSIYNYDKRARYGGPKRISMDVFALAFGFDVCWAPSENVSLCAQLPLRFVLNTESSLPNCAVDLEVSISRPPNWDGDGDNSNDNDITFTVNAGPLSLSAGKKGGYSKKVCVWSK